MLNNPDLAALSEAAKAKAEAMAVRYYEGIPIRVLERDGRVIWSKVDDELRDLTTENSEGLLFHVRSVFVPHGKPNPLSAFSDHTDNLVQIDEGMRERVGEAIAQAMHGKGFCPFTHPETYDFCLHLADAAIAAMGGAK